MKHSTLRLTLLDDNEDEPVDDGAGTTPADDTDLDGVDAELDSPDTESDTEDNPVDGEEEGDGEVDDSPIKLAKTTGLQVDRLARLNANKEQRDLRKAVSEKSLEIESAKEDILLLSNAMESARLVRRGERFDRGNELAIVSNLALKYGLRSTKVSLEGHCLTVSPQIALEGFKDVFKAILDKIFAAIKALAKMLQKIFQYFFSNNAKVSKAIDLLTDKSLKFDEANESKLFDKLTAKGISSSKYMSADLGIKQALSIKGKFFNEAMIDIHEPRGNKTGEKKLMAVDSYERTLILVQSVTFFINESAHAFVMELEKLLANPTEQRTSSPAVQKLDPSEAMSPEAYRVSQVGGYRCPDDKLLFATEGFIGNLYILDEYAAVRNGDDVNSCLEFVGKWSRVYRYDESELMDEKMPRLNSADVRAVSEKAKAVGRVLDSCHNWCNDFEAQTSKIKQLATALGSKSEQLTAIEDYDDVLMHKRIVALTMAASSWVNNGTRSLDACLRYGLRIQTAWAKYLKLRLETDLQHMKA